MQKRVTVFGTITLFLTIFSLPAYAVEKAINDVKKQNEATYTLNYSKDGKAILDQNGKEIARFAEDVQIKPVAAGDRLPGCMRCWDECLVYDSNGNCIKTYRTCQWDFDCKK